MSEKKSYLSIATINGKPHIGLIWTYGIIYNNSCFPEFKNNKPISCFYVVGEITLNNINTRPLSEAQKKYKPCKICLVKPNNTLTHTISSP